MEDEPLEPPSLSSPDPAPNTGAGGIDARDSHGLIAGNTGKVEQQFGDKVDTGGGDHVGQKVVAGAGSTVNIYAGASFKRGQRATGALHG